MKSYDILINNEPYLFGPRGGIGMGSALMEPGSPREIGTILIPSARHGYGQRINRDPEKAETLNKVDVGEGFLMPTGQLGTEAFVTDAFWSGSITGSPYTPDTQFHARPCGSLYVPESGKFFVIFPRKIVEYNLSTGATTDRLSAPAIGADFFCYTGTVARWRDMYVFGIESTGVAIAIPGDDSQRQGEHWASYTHFSDTFANQTGDAIDMSHVVTTSNKVVRIDNVGRNYPPAIHIADDPTTNFGSLSWVGPIHIPGGGYCTGMYLLGPHVVLAKSNGSLMGMDTGEVFTPLMHTRRAGVSDDFFGANAPYFLHFLILPGSQTLTRLDPNTLEQAPFNPAAIQGLGVDDDTDAPVHPYCAATRDTEEIWVFGNDGSDENTKLTKGRLYSDGKFSYTNSMAIASQRKARHLALVINPPSLIGDAIVMVSQGVSDPTKGHIQVLMEYSYGYHEIPAGYAVPANYKSSRLSADGAAAGLSVRPLQIRFWREMVGATTSWAASISVEDGAFQSLGTIGEGVGTTVLTVPDLPVDIGRYFQIQLVGNTLPAGQKQVIEFPIAIDYAYVPNTKDMISIKVTATSEQIHNLGGEWTRKSGRSIADELIDLRGTVVPIKFTDDTEWSVIIEEVGADMIAQEEPRTNSPTWLVTLDCRRL